MKKIILLTLVGTGLLVTMPFTAQALDSDKIAQYDRDRYRDDQDRDYEYGDDRRSRPFVVYYRSSDNRRWIYQSVHYNRREARRAANRLERQGYRTLVLG
ncbi:hypothetical protein [Chamaesiphon polymorphus]|uniref:SPOR domain-containing protein n=1 Tax=Chamaesiphon polymorphus CCALA 037 TaxID=2107692 RepID=A0A2T1GN95_9CYAN|nr:hypothetical protein [Chamaesiphon polymorphus]PSB59388.1 hypothetical protein C7B77_01260 [Chamaesiphon polymorphus CCALA 037]